MEAKLLDVNIQLRREEMIKTLLDLRKAKSTEENIKGQITKFEQMVKTELQQLDKKLADLKKQTEANKKEADVNVPAKVAKFK